MLTGLIAGSLSLSGCSVRRVADEAVKEDPRLNESTTQVLQRPEVVTSGTEALKLLKAGNERFTSGELANKDLSGAKREELTAGQKPFAVILSCSDSRVPPELLFDQGLGDLFIIRVAGNIVDPENVGSVEYAVEHLHAPLVVVLGHEKCGAVKATVEGGEAPGSIGTLVERIKPAVEEAKAAGASGDRLVEKAVNENVDNMLAQLEESPILKEGVERGKLKIVGAKYHLGSGQVEWFSEE